MRSLPASLLLPGQTRRQFIATSLALGASLACHRIRAGEATRETDFIDLHQHHGSGRGRTDAELIRHQQAIGATLTVILPGSGASNATARAFAAKDPKRWVCFAREAIDQPGFRPALERHLQQGAIGIGELKDQIACDSPAMEQIAEVAKAHGVPVLIHFEDGAWNDGYPRFHRMLEKYPAVTFIGHAQTFWAHIDSAFKGAGGDYPKGSIMPGGLTDRWLKDYPNFFGDLSANSGNNALSRDPVFAADFVNRHQDKLMFGSDCPCVTGTGPLCISATKLVRLRELALSPGIRAKLLADNARRVLKLPAV